MTCERCGKEMPDNAAICPSCGTVTQIAENRPPISPTTTYGQFPTGEYNDPYDPQPTPTYEYEQGYTYTAQSQPTHTPPKDFGYQSAYNPPPMYQQPPINVTVVNNFPAAPSNKNGAALITEIILSLFSIYGVGWLMAGETTIGVVLLVCSFMVFWPLLITIASVTFGLGICFCNLPLAIAGIIINAILLNNRLKRKAFSPPFQTVQAQRMQMPPRQRPRQD